MKILFDNVDFSSSSGPNNFALKLARNITGRGNEVITSDNIANNDIDIQLSFIFSHHKISKMVQRLDGIYFNSQQSWESLNLPILKTYNVAEGVIFQSKFNKELTELYFGKKEKSVIIHNGTDLGIIGQIPVLNNEFLNRFNEVWVCASSWRPHKRLDENIRYFLEHAPESDCLIVAGADAQMNMAHDRIFHVGNISWTQLISLYKKASHFIHLAFLDHCPNVVIDARACGCNIICSSSGGTREIAGKDAVIVGDLEWDFKPLKLYEPPKLDFTKKNVASATPSIDINDVAASYITFFKEII